MADGTNSAKSSRINVDRTLDEAIRRAMRDSVTLVRLLPGAKQGRCSNGFHALPHLHQREGR